MNMKKRGLSDVVTTVLIILLVLAAVAIIWGYLGNTLNKAGSQITSACLTLDLKAVSCKSSATEANISYQRNSGEGNLINVTAIFDIGGQSVTRTVTPIPNQLETLSNRTTGLSGKATSVKVAGTIMTESGATKLCDPSPVVQCS